MPLLLTHSLVPSSLPHALGCFGGLYDPLRLIPASLALAIALAGQASPFNGKTNRGTIRPTHSYPDPRDWVQKRERRLPPPRSGYP